jgi:DNA-binding PadR family transcriptional regulator
MTSTVYHPLTIEHALLGYLAERPMHGYDIYRQVRRSDGLGVVWRIKRSQLYALLTKLEALGYITASLEQQIGRPARRVFHLSEAGRAAFAEWVTSPVSRPRDLRLDFLARLYFARRESAELAFQLVHRQRARCLEWLHEYTTRLEACPPEQSFEGTVWQFRVRQIEAILDWLDACGTPRPGG